MLVDDGNADRGPHEPENSSFGVMGLSFSRIVTIAFTIYLLHHLTKILRKYIRLHICVDNDRSNDWKTICMNALRSLSNGVDNCFTVMEDGFPYKVYLYWTEESKPEVRRFCMEKNVGISGQMKFFLAKIQELYPKLRTMTYTIAWKDEDEDEVLISTDDEVQTMVTASSDVDVIRLYVRVTGTKIEEDAEITDVPSIPAATTSSSASPPSVHITCDGCGSTIAGFRYKCLTCDDYDLCVYCETVGKHPEHCVVRVPTANVTVPLIRDSIKKSRRFLKSVASQVNDENKRQRRAAKHSREHSAPQSSKGKPDPQQPRPPRRNWVEVFTKYMEEFTNLAGDLNRGAEPKEPKPATAEKILHPTNEEIDANPWGLSEPDLEKLQHACKFARQNALRASVKTFNKMVEVATTAAEEAAARSSIAFAFPPLRASLFAPQTPDASTPVQVPTPQATTPPKVSTPPGVATPPETATEPVAMPANEAFKPTPEVAKLAQEAKAKLAKAVQKKELEERIREALLKAEKSQAKLSLLNATVTEEPKTDEDEACPEGAMSSNASSAGSEKGWTVLDDLKDDLAEAENAGAVNLLDMPEEFQDRVRIHAKIYPPLNTATAVLDPQVPAAASAPPPPNTENMTQAMPTQTKPAQAMPTQNKPAKAMPTQTRPAQTMPTHTQAVPTLGAHIQAALEQMIAMGFSNDNDWLTHLLNSNDGNIAAVLELISPAIK